MKQHVARIARTVAGFFLLILGVIGLFVPILQGVFLIILGMWVLSIDSRWAHRCILKLRLRFPAVHRKVRQLRRRIRDRFGSSGRREGPKSS